MESADGLPRLSGAELHGGWTHQVRPGLVLWRVQETVQSDIRVVSGGDEAGVFSHIKSTHRMKW